jgi:alkyl sulfatase BDS1-like metallo-beta-lactamase superfamily hydrolase
MLALKNSFDPDAAGDLRLIAEIRFATDTFLLAVDDGTITVRRGAADQPDVVLETDPQTLEEIAFGMRSVRSVERAAALRVIGDRSRLQRLLDVFDTSPDADTEKRPAERG